ncbi:MAG: hypothetical protein EOP10_12265 [Proteobacteria bacterium]|nr:MAG: hypothetical protein EOP10_12265 [Pseudomonadota bacterium]
MFRPSFCLLAFIAFFSWFSDAQAFDIGAESNAIRDRSNARRVTLTIQLKGVNATDRQTFGILSDDVGLIQQAIANTLDICLSPTAASCSETDVHVLWTLTRKPTPQVDNNYLSRDQAANFDSDGTTYLQDVSDPNLYEYVIRIIIDDAANDIPVGTKVLLRFFPDRVSSNGNKDANNIVANLGSGVRDTLAISNTLGTPKSLIVSIANSPSVTFMNNSKGAPTGAVAILIPEPKVDPKPALSIPTLSYEADPLTTPATPGNCPLTVDWKAKTCSVNCAAENAQSLDIDRATAAGYRTAKTAKPTDKTIGFTNVSIAEGPYAIIVSYLPEGTAFSCAIGEATDAATLVQLGGGSDLKTGDPNCFIATAAYGTAMDPHIDVLRWFRDRYLLESAWGKSFVRFYYKTSPPLAHWIGEHEWARTLTRGALWTPILLLKAYKDHQFLTLIVLLLFSALIIRRLRRAAI